MPEVKKNTSSEIMNKYRDALIHIYDPEKPTNEAIKKLEKATNEALDGLKSQQRLMRYAMIAVVGVVTVGFITSIIGVFVIFIDSQRNSAQKYTEYIEVIKSQESTIQSLKQGEMKKTVDSVPTLSTTTSNK